MRGLLWLNLPIPWTPRDATIVELTAQVKVGDDLTGSFFEALKPLKLQHSTHTGDAAIMIREFIGWRLRHWLYRPSCWLARYWVTQPALALARWACCIQISAEQLTLIAKIIKNHPGCKLLIFGLGNDSPLWHSLNKDGVTMFLEDDRHWFQDVTTRQPALAAFLVAYGTRLTEWHALLHCPDSLHMELPSPVIDTAWDVVLVDAPAGRAAHFPGRMQSIFAAAKLAKDGGDIFVHDCEREVEAAYCDHYLKPEQLQAELRYPEGWLRHYRARSSPMEELHGKSSAQRIDCCRSLEIIPSPPVRRASPHAPLNG